MVSEVFKSFVELFKIRSVLKNSTPTVSNGVSNFGIGPIAVNLVGFEVARLTRIGKKVDKKTFFFVNPIISNEMRSAPKRKILMFDPPFDARGSKLFSASQVNTVRQM